MHHLRRRVLALLGRPSRFVRFALLLTVLAAIAAAVATLGRNPDLSHVRVAVLSGSKDGNYYATVAKAAEAARRQRGRIDNVQSAGSVENITRLAAAKNKCDVQFALVQDGVPWPESHPFQLVGRLPTSETFVMLGRDADRIRSVADLRGMRVGIGPVGSGTEYVSRQVLAQLEVLGIKAATHPLGEQLAMLERDELDLGAMVIDPDAKILVEAVRDRKLQITDISGADALAHQLRSARAGIIKAGHYDPVRVLPPTDKHVIEIDTLLITNGCAHESVTQGAITALTRVFPDFVRVNRERPNLTGLEYASAARSYFDNQGPDPVGEYVPWLIDIMPTARWLQFIFAFSLLFGAQAAFHRFRLWRIDAARVSIEGELSRQFAPRITPEDIDAESPQPRHSTPEGRAELDAIVRELEQLSRRCRRQSVSMMVPMGQEMMYRYQEGLIADWLQALRNYRARLGGSSPRG